MESAGAASEEKGEMIPFWESYDSVAALMDHKHGAGIAAEHNVVNRHVAQKVVYAPLNFSSVLLSKTWIVAAPLRFGVPQAALIACGCCSGWSILEHCTTALEC